MAFERRTCRRSSSTDDPSTGKIEVLSWLNKTTLDVIGLAGFNHSFDALSPNESYHELNGAIRTLLKNPENPSTLDILHILIPATRVVKSKRDVEIAEARAILDRVGKQFLAERKGTVLASGESKVQRKDVVGKDLLSLLVRDNMASDIPEDSRMTDEEVLAQVLAPYSFRTLPALTRSSWVPTSLLAGHETTFTAALGRALTNRAWRRSTDFLTLTASVSKGDSIFLPFLALSKSEEIRGADANEWKPERWAKGVPRAAASIPGIWGNTFSFSGGARAMKAIIYTLVRAFRLSMSIAPSSIKFKSTAVTRPHLKDKVHNVPRLPLWVSLVDSEAGYVHVA
ncbi:unnamed protein product [Peniophora sp. CBMAI 1063]|nr:unnamed protein product [Peniophora sp. CBMAI 1063]